MDTTLIDAGLSAAPPEVAATSPLRPCRPRLPDAAAGQFEVDWQLPCPALRDTMR